MKRVKQLQIQVAINTKDFNELMQRRDTLQERAQCQTPVPLDVGVLNLFLITTTNERSGVDLKGVSLIQVMEQYVCDPRYSEVMV